VTDSDRQHPPGNGTSTREEALQRALAAHRAQLERTTAAIEADAASGGLSPAQAADAVRAARALYSTVSDLAAVEADYPGWETWVGVGGVLYARRPKTSPPKVVRAPSVQALREAIERRCQR